MDTLMLIKLSSPFHEVVVNYITLHILEECKSQIPNSMYMQYIFMNISKKKRRKEEEEAKGSKQALPDSFGNHIISVHRVQTQH